MSLFFFFLSSSAFQNDLDSISINLPRFARPSPEHSQQKPLHTKNAKHVLSPGCCLMATMEIAESSDEKPKVEK